jgi:hypothetical protein
VTGLLEWRQDGSRQWTGRLGGFPVAVIHTPGPLDGSEHWYSTGDLLPGAFPCGPRGIGRSRVDAQAAAEDAVRAWLTSIGYAGNPASVKMEAREVDRGGTKPDERDLYLAGVKVGRAWIPATVRGTPDEHWVCRIDDSRVLSHLGDAFRGSMGAWSLASPGPPDDGEAADPDGRSTGGDRL